MNALLGNLAFLNPTALLALLALPALYLLLRVTPPAPKVVAFPALRLLEGLQPKQNTPSHTPWWILLLRMLMAALLLLALARPVLNPLQATETRGDVLLLIDNGWSSAQNWDDIQTAAENQIKQAARNNQQIRFMTTAADASGQAPQLLGPLTESDALSQLRASKPQPWPVDLQQALDALQDYDGGVIYFADGVRHANHRAFYNEVSGQISAIYAPSNANLPFVLKAHGGFQTQPEILIDGSSASARDLPIRVQLLGEKGSLLDEISVETSGKNFPLKASFDIPAALQNRVSSFQLAGAQGANAKYFLDDVGGPKSVGIVSSAEIAQTRQFTEDSFYLRKALEPYATVSQGSLDAILETKPSVIILPDIGTMPQNELNELSAWVDEGGLLLRFAGPNMTQSNRQNALTPNPLRAEARNVKGSLSWDKPLKLAPLTPDSPLYGIGFDEEVEVSGQILPAVNAGSQDENAAQSWILLEDGTPLMTAKQQEQGLIVMVHTTASPLWSNLALSGVYVDMLKRLLTFAGQSNVINTNRVGALQPVRVIDGFGALQSPGQNVKPLDLASLDEYTPSPDHPPGFYASSGLQQAFNLGDSIPEIRALSTSVDLPLQPYGQTYETDLIPALLTAALFLLIIDALVMIWISRSFGKLKMPSLKTTASIVFCSLVMSSNAFAQEIDASQDLYIAYIQTGDAQIDSTTREGLKVLSAALNIRTSAEPAGVVSVNPERDTLAFFPLIYWPITSSQPEPSTEAIRNLQNYIDHGGTILVDTRQGSARSEDLRRLMGDLNVPPLAKISDDHVLTRTFYLLDSFPGRFENADLWVENQNTNDRDGVSSIILGGNDWVGGWSELEVIDRGSRQYLMGKSDRHEMSLRFGINLMMYALTGNYKTDQVHVPHILERLDQ